MPFSPNPGVPASVIVAQAPPFVKRVGAATVELRPPSTGLKAGKAEATLVVTPAGSLPTLRLSMPAMAMMAVENPTLVPTAKPGEYRLAMTFPHAGRYRLAMRVGNDETAFDLDVKPADDASSPLGEGREGVGMEDMKMKDMDMGEMSGVLGPWSMAREGSGTSWMPDESPMFMKMLPNLGRFSLSYMGNFSLDYTDSNVADGRGPHEFYSNSMPMLMARRGLANGDVVGFRIMGSLDPIFNGQFGAPNLFQTGETAHGQTLVDRQHPHDLLAEVSATYSHSLGGGNRAFVYLAPIGEPALADSMYLMRPSGMENPEAPITHHWFDSSHITFGVVTGGLELGDKVKIDGSFFNGKEPDENRYSPDNLRLDSSTIRLTANPTKALSFSASFAALHQPEHQEEGDQHRLTATAQYSRELRNGDAFAATALFGRDVNEGRQPSDAYLLEASLYRRDWSYYGRFENVQKDELVGVPKGRHTIDKWTFGATKDFAHRGGFDFGVDAYAGLYDFGSSLRDEYGSFPVSLGVYLRLRPSRMKRGDMAGMRM